MHGLYYGWGMGYGWILWIVLLFFVIWLANKVFTQKKTSNQSGTKSPMDILKERYARGEIRKEEFDIMKKDLQ